MLPRYDFHIHSAFSVCADPSMTLRAIVAEAERLRLQAIGITDHYYGPDRVGEQAAVGRELAEIETPVELYFGVEAGFGYKLGRHPLSREEQLRHGFQYAIGSHHSTYLREYDIEKIVATQHEHHLKTCEDPSIDVLGHPWRFLKPEFEREGWPWLETMKVVPESMTRELARAAVETGTAVEMNTTSNLTNLKVPESYHREYAEYLAILAEEGVAFSLATDAHQVSELATVETALGVAGGLGLTDERIWAPECEPVNEPVPRAGTT